MQSGDRIAGWKVVRFDGEGPTWHYATVVRGSERARLVVLHPSDELCRERLQSTARVLAVVVHPNVLRVLGWVDHGDDVAIITEPPPSADLARWIATGPHDLGETLRIFRGIVAGLGALHEVSLVHRLLEPTRVRLGRSAGRLTPKIDDTILGELTTSEATPTTDPHGVPRYVAPEAFQGAEATQGADLFAAGCLLYEMLTGRPAFDGDDVIAVYDAIANARYVPPVRRRPDLPDVVSDLVDDLLQPNPDRRPAEADEVLERLDAGKFAGWISRATALPVDPTDLPPLEGVSTGPQPLIDEEDSDTGPSFDPNALPELSPPTPPAPPPPIEVVPTPRVDPGLEPRPMSSVPPDFGEVDPWDPLSEDAPRPVRMTAEPTPMPTSPRRRKRRQPSLLGLRNPTLVLTWSVVLFSLGAAFLAALVLLVLIVW